MAPSSHGLIGYAATLNNPVATTASLDSSNIAIAYLNRGYSYVDGTGARAARVQH